MYEGFPWPEGIFKIKTNSFKKKNIHLGICYI